MKTEVIDIPGAAPVGDGIEANSGRWTFDGSVADVFDQHVSKSVPLYEEGHRLILQLSDFFLTRNSVCYDVGCSTGTLLSSLAARHHGREARFIGLDPVENMVERAKQKCRKFPDVTIVVADALEFEFESADLFTSYYTVQFVHPKHRQTLIDNIYKSLTWGGAFIMFEKVRASDARFQDLMTQCFLEHKLAQGYTPDEIIQKSLSLKGILEPFSTAGNLGLLNRAGFVDVLPIAKYMCFEGYLAIK
jgi:tRNA (cmo5U34)-methyltransferase